MQLELAAPSGSYHIAIAWGAGRASEDVHGSGDDEGGQC